MRFLAALLVSTAACNADFTLPAKPEGGVRHTITGFSPVEGFTGATVAITGTRFGISVEDVQVRFGQSATVRPLTVAEERIEVVVPEEAQTGPVAVLVRGSSAVSSASFTFRGVGYLRHGRVRATADLRPQMHALFPFGAGATLAAFAAEFVGPRVTFNDVLLFTNALDIESLGGEVRAVVPAGASAVGVLDDRATSDECGHLRRVTLDAFKLPMEQVATLTDSEFICPGVLRDAAFDDAGSHAVAISTSKAWGVDFSTATPTVTELGAGGYFNRVKWIGNDRFLILEGANVRPVVRSAWRMDAATDIFPGIAGNLAAIDAIIGTNRNIIALGTEGTLTNLDSTNWPPYTQRTIPPLRKLSESFDRDVSIGGTEGFWPVVAVSLPEADVVQVWNTQTGHALASLPVLSPRRITYAPAQDAWYVAGLGGATVINASTNAQIDRVDISADLRNPRLRKSSFSSPCAAEPDTLLSVASRTFNTLVDLNPCTLEPVFVHDRMPWPPLEAIATAPGLNEVFVLHQQHLHRGPPVTGSDAHRLVRSRFFEVENTEAIWQAPETEADDARAFFVTPDAAAVVWHYRSAAGTDTVQVIDVATEKLGLAHVAADELALVRADGAGHLALVDYPPNATPQPGSKVRVLDLGAARAGSAQDVFAEVTLPHRLFRGVVAAGKLFASVEDALGVQLLDLGTGGLSESPTEIAIDLRLGLSGSDLNTAGRVSLAASPSARRLWALSASAGEVRLLSQKVDPETGTFGEQDQLVPVTPGAVEFYAYSDGENVIVLDAKGDQLLLLE